MRLFLAIVLSALAVSCAETKYASVRKGQFGGRLMIEWIGPDEFIYRRDAQRPFHFVRSDGTIITPQNMYTDGGSIPRPLWALRGYSPWGYGPAFIIHDWLFVAHKWHLSEAAGHTVDSAAEVMSEGIKTIMEKDPSLKNAFHLYSMDQAVRSPVAAGYWNDPTPPPHPPDEPAASFERRAAPMMARAPAAAPSSGPRRKWVETRDFDAER